MKKLFALTPLLLSLFGCASTDSNSESTAVAGPTTTTAQARIGKAVVSPLTDLNLMPTNIPAVITQALNNPYQLPVNINCEALSEQVQALNAALGPDLDTFSREDKRTNIEKGSAMASDSAVGAIESTISGAVPFRSWLRKLSGAEKKSKELNEAIAAGIVRRSYLKGMGEALKCLPPAAPLNHETVTAQKSE
ncbi:hypothetical protein [Solimicrobium silvestre]|uniref:Lipoprotein n=1 Tax=Solimicrobium silvestre TaxID=2099400 RepID=A0A2S9GY11_9BURK|nr:hypothetical protein [Solimicrobium silvestre]PRC92603.1 hypothetical protein S2091_2658 [Solimicrobium silvestre]